MNILHEAKPNPVHKKAHDYCFSDINSRPERWLMCLSYAVLWIAASYGVLEHGFAADFWPEIMRCWPKDGVEWSAMA